MGATVATLEMAIDRMGLDSEIAAGHRNVRINRLPHVRLFVDVSPQTRVRRRKGVGRVGMAKIAR